MAPILTLLAILVGCAGIENNQIPTTAGSIGLSVEITNVIYLARYVECDGAYQRASDLILFNTGNSYESLPVIISWRVHDSIAERYPELKTMISESERLSDFYERRNKYAVRVSNEDLGLSCGDLPGDTCLAVKSTIYFDPSLKQSEFGQPAVLYVAQSWEIEMARYSGIDLSRVWKNPLITYGRIYNWPLCESLYHELDSIHEFLIPVRMIEEASQLSPDEHQVLTSNGLVKYEKGKFCLVYFE